MADSDSVTMNTLCNSDNGTFVTLDEYLPHTALLRWPDVQQAAAYILGFRIVGDIEFSNIFRQLQPSTLRRTTIKRST